MRRLRTVALGLASFGVGACGLLLGLDDHELAPPAGDATPPVIDSPRPDVATECGDTSSDPHNCGACGVTCGSGYACRSGNCDNRVIAVAAGDAHGCALLRNGTVWCWGSNALGQSGPPLGGALCAGNCRGPSEVTGLKEVIQIGAGGRSSCALKVDGSVWCWGRNAVGELGHTGTDPICNGDICNPIPRQVAPLQPVVQISVGAPYACARSALGEVFCWGDNTYGQLGNGVIGNNSPVPVQATVSDAIDVSASMYGATTCAAKRDGSVWCWGLNTRGGLGHTGNDAVCFNGAACNATPTPVASLADATRVLSARSVACARQKDAGYSCWGNNGFAQLGIGTADPAMHVAPTPLTVLASAAALDARSNHVCAIDNAGAAWCWGFNFWGAVGDGTIDGEPCESPTQPYCKLKAAKVKGMPPVAAISAGTEQTVALGTDGVVWAWGANFDGRLGHDPADSGDQRCNGDATDRACVPDPAPLKGLP